MFHVIKRGNITCVIDTIKLTLYSVNTGKTYEIHTDYLGKADIDMSDLNKVFVRFKVYKDAIECGTNKIIKNAHYETKCFSDGKLIDSFRSKKNLENFLKTLDSVQDIQYNTSIKKQDNTNTNTIKKDEVKTMNQFLKNAMNQVTNNPYVGLTKVKAVDLLQNFKTITIVSFDRTQDTNGNPSYRCKIAEDTNIYFYATSELKSMFTIALKETTVEILNQELPLKFDIEPSTVEYNGQTYPSVKYSIHQELTIA